ncbi:MAG: sterol desaturase family protein [Acidimicrobiales bacterium]
MTLALVIVSFVVMEPVAYLAHRFVMHGVGAAWHRGHHRPRRTTFEANDLYPVVMASVTVVAFVIGASVGGFGVLTPVAGGVTLYGIAYVYVHDIAIHRRVGWIPVPDIAAVRYVREAHRIHHLWSGEPFGFLCPIVPAPLRRKARAVERDPLVATQPA